MHVNAHIHDETNTIPTHWTKIISTWTQTKRSKDELVHVLGRGSYLQQGLRAWIPGGRGSIYIYIYLFIHIHTNIYIYIYVRIKLCMCVCVYIYIHIDRERERERERQKERVAAEPLNLKCKVGMPTQNGNMEYYEP